MSSDEQIRGHAPMVNRSVVPNGGEAMKCANGLAITCLLTIASSSCSEDKPEIRIGKWGGLGMEMNVTTSGATLTICCSSGGAIEQRLVPDASGNFVARGTVFTLRADYRGTVSGDSMRLQIVSYPETDPSGFIIKGVDGSDYWRLTYGIGFVRQEAEWGCFCPPCVGCPP